MKCNRKETTNLCLKSGQGRLTLVSMIVGDIRTRQKRTAIINRIHNLKTDIARIQETHGAITTKTQPNEYIIYQGKERESNEYTPNKTLNANLNDQKIRSKKEKGRVAIAIKENTTQIHRKS